ncbi:MAG: DUF1893 domain-containing protein [Bacillota bacterium]|jgi:hypothetical protein
MDVARRCLEEGFSVAAVKEGRILGRETGAGARPFFLLYLRLGGNLSGSSVADRVVGRAVALGAAAAGCARLHGDVMGKSALELLEKSSVNYNYGRLVPRILDRSGQGPCPVERLSEETRDLEELLEALRGFWGDLPEPKPGDQEER